MRLLLQRLVSTRNHDWPRFRRGHFHCCGLEPIGEVVPLLPLVPEPNVLPLLPNVLLPEPNELPELPKELLPLFPNVLPELPKELPGFPKGLLPLPNGLLLFVPSFPFMLPPPAPIAPMAFIWSSIGK